MIHFIMPTLFLNVEKWKWNSEYRIYVSNKGHFKNEHKQNLAVKVKSSGYLAIKTYSGNKLAHRLVLLTWRPIPNAEEMTVDHLDHNKRNNSLNNLEWVTAEENSRRAASDFIDEHSYKTKKQKEPNKKEIYTKYYKEQLERALPVKLVNWEGKTYNSFEEAALDIMINCTTLKTFYRMKKTKRETALNRIGRRIKRSINENGTYAGGKWQYEVL